MIFTSSRRKLDFVPGGLTSASLCVVQESPFLSRRSPRRRDRVLRGGLRRGGLGPGPVQQGPHVGAVPPPLRADEHWLEPLLTGITANISALIKGDEASFVSRAKLHV